MKPILDLRSLAVMPAVVVTLLCFVGPLGVMVVYSFWSRVDGKLDKSWTFVNYEAFWTRPFLFHALVNSIEVTVLVTLLSTLVAYPLAYVLAYGVPKQWQRLSLILVVLPFWTSYVIRSYAWLLVLSENGVISQGLQAVGLADGPVGMANTRGATILGFVHYFMMLSTLTIFANLVQIKDSYRLAAADLGASGFRTFLYVTLPLSIPGVAVGAFLTFVSAIGDYITPQVLGGAKEMLLPQAIILVIGREADFPAASAVSMVLMILISVVYMAFAGRLRMDRV